MRLRVITDASPIEQMAVVGGFLFAARDKGLDRWSLANGTAISMSSAHGLPGDHVLAMAPDDGRGWLWLVTDGGIGYYEAATEVFSEVAPPTESQRQTLVAAGARLRVSAATDGGLWVGHHEGLFHVSAQGVWTETPVRAAVHHLAVSDGWVWVATDDGLFARSPAGKFAVVGSGEGCLITEARLVVALSQQQVIALGSDDGGSAVAAVRVGKSWYSYRLGGAIRWEYAGASKQGALFVVGQQVVQVSVGEARAAAPLSFSALTAGAPALAVTALDAQLPSHVTSFRVAEGSLFVGTSETGIARFPHAGVRPSAWFHRGPMFDGAQSLSVACQSQGDCWLAVGSRQAWHWRGDRFEAGGPDRVVLAVVQSDAGVIYALHRGSDEHAISVSRVEGSTWQPVGGIELRPPGDHPNVSFARFAPDGKLWVGLQYVVDEETRPWGIAVADIARGKVAYHRQTQERSARRRGVLPIPMGAVDVAFVSANETWFATSEGAARLTGNKVELWNESSSLPSELLRGLAASSGGVVYVASGAGVGQFDGEAWKFPRELAFSVNAVAISGNGKVWMATDRGLAVYDGTKVRRLDERHGMVDREIQNLTQDRFGRMWARGPRSLVLVTP
jgi:ligand-binding sensor domain-containing protein